MARTGGAQLVAAGILLSRLFGLARQKVTAHYLGSGVAADALAAAFRIPNLLQNLFGEGSLSASFIPVYARLLAEGRRDEAGRVAGAVFALLALLVTLLVALGLAVTPWLVGFVAPGFDADARALTIQLVRIIFPGLGLLVLSAWCLGILNAHRHFLLSYASPVLWNAAIITGLVLGGQREILAQTVLWAAAASVLGAALQFGVQVPRVLSLQREMRLSAGPARPEVQTVLRNFGPAVATRGVVQVSAYVDTMIASLLGAGALATLSYAQVISLLPVSLFGMSIAAAELPEMSAALGEDSEIAAALRERLASGLQRIAFFVIPSAVAFVALGGALAGALYEGGAFTAEDTQWVWVALAGSGVGLLAGTMGRLYSSAAFALRDTRTPFRYATLRVSIAAVLGATLALTLPQRLGIDLRWGVGLLTAASGLAAWLEFLLLRRYVGGRVGVVRVEAALLARLWTAAIIAGVAGWATAYLLRAQPPLPLGVAACAVFGAVYLGLARALGADRARRA